MAFLYLLIAVIAEVLATSALKATNGFTAPLPIVLTIVGYAIALFFLGLTFKSIPMGLLTHCGQVLALFLFLQSVGFTLNSSSTLRRLLV